jgi:similar to stage IV sporulation protein
MIRVEGLSLERFLNLASQAGVKVFDVKRVSYTVLYAGLSARGYSKLIKIVPAQFVWDVQVTGISAYEGAKIKAELAEKGIRPGVYKGNLDLKAITTDMIIAHDEIAWLNIDFKGVAVVVKILPADMPPEIYDENTPCDIIAKKDAYIEKIIPLAGKAVVKPGDTVRAGDKLIAGLVWDPGFPRMMFAAKGKVLGSVWYKGEESASIYRETREKTGRTQDERVVYMGNDSASIDGPCTFEEFDTEVVKEYYLGDRLFLPVRVALLRHSEVKLTKTPAPLDILMTYLEERAYWKAQCLAPDDAKITGHSAAFKVDNDVLSATVYLQTQEDIGKVVYLEE